LLRRTIPIQIAVIGAVLLIVLIVLAGPRLAVWAEALLVWVEGLGKLGPFVMIGGFVAVCIFSVPGAPLTLGCGFLFGTLEGTAIAAAGSTLGATAAFLIARFGGRRFIRAKVARKIRFRRLDRAARHHGFTIVLLTRISPFFPFNLLNYIYGLTSVSFRAYILATLIGVIPVSFLYVYVGSLMKTLAQVAAGKVDPSALHPWVITTGLVLTIGAVVLLATIARRMLEKALHTETRMKAQSAKRERVESAGTTTDPVVTGKDEKGFDLFERRSDTEAALQDSGDE